MVQKQVKFSPFCAWWCKNKFLFSCISGQMSETSSPAEAKGLSTQDIVRVRADLKPPRSKNFAPPSASCIHPSHPHGQSRPSDLSKGGGKIHPNSGFVGLEKPVGNKWL